MQGVVNLQVGNPTTSACSQALAEESLPRGLKYSTQYLKAAMGLSLGYEAKKDHSVIASTEKILEITYRDFLLVPKLIKTSESFPSLGCKGSEIFIWNTSKLIWSRHRAGNFHRRFSLLKLAQEQCELGRVDIWRLCITVFLFLSSAPEMLMSPSWHSISHTILFSKPSSNIILPAFSVPRWPIVVKNPSSSNQGCFQRQCRHLLPSDDKKRRTFQPQDLKYPGFTLLEGPCYS